MTLSKIKEFLNCQVLYEYSNLSFDIKFANASDLMSSLSREDIIATVFAPPDTSLLEWGITYNKSIERLEKRRSDGVWLPRKFP